jgi:hypothetical protein
MRSISILFVRYITLGRVTEGLVRNSGCLNAAAPGYAFSSLRAWNVLGCGKSLASTSSYVDAAEGDVVGDD